MRSFLNFYQNLDIWGKISWNSHRIRNWTVQNVQLDSYGGYLDRRLDIRWIKLIFKLKIGHFSLVSVGQLSPVLKLFSQLISHIVAMRIII